jgi:hypothetical protein
VVVNNLRLPISFVQFAGQPDVVRQWMVKEERDAYGNEWGLDVDIYTDPETFVQETNQLHHKFKLDHLTPEIIEAWNAWSPNSPGFLRFITDFSHIVQFGANGAGENYCFDFRDEPHQPGVIYWEDCRWRRVAPDFETFMSLLEPFTIEGWECKYGCV